MFCIPHRIPKHLDEAGFDELIQFLRLPLAKGDEVVNYLNPFYNIRLHTKRRYWNLKRRKLSLIYNWNNRRIRKCLQVILLSGQCISEVDAITFITIWNNGVNLLIKCTLYFIDSDFANYTDTGKQNTTLRQHSGFVTSKFGYIKFTFT